MKITYFSLKVTDTSLSLIRIIRFSSRISGSIFVFLPLTLSAGCFQLMRLYHGLFYKWKMMTLILENSDIRYALRMIGVCHDFAVRHLSLFLPKLLALHLRTHQPREPSRCHHSSAVATFLHEKLESRCTKTGSLLSFSRAFLEGACAKPVRALLALYRFSSYCGPARGVFRCTIGALAAFIGIWRYSRARAKSGVSSVGFTE